MANPVPYETLPEKLLDTISKQSTRYVSPDYTVFVDVLRKRFNTATDAIILYGSCLRTGNLDEGIADLYVLVDDYKKAYTQRYLGVLNAWLSPNVFYLEVNHQDRTLRAKYAVISTTDFENGARYWFHSYIWARFAQPSRLLYARNEATQERTYRAIAHSVITFLRSGASTLNNTTIDTETLWTQCLMLSYAAELRPEKEIRAKHLAALNHYEFAQLTHAAYPMLTDILSYNPDTQYYLCQNAPNVRRRSLRNWLIRRWQGRILSILRLSKATLTFKDCLDYAAWKIERHTGVNIEITPWLRRHPILWGFSVVWQILRKGAIR